MTKVSGWVGENWGLETLRDTGLTSASNESSVILYGNVDGRRILLNGDAGQHALRWAADYANANSLPLQQFSCVQIPHHGSRRNVGPAILNRLLGPIRPANSTSTFTAIVSAPKDDENHPRKVVMNAFIRRGATVLATQGIGKCFPGGFAARPGYFAADSVPLSSQVEAYDDN